MEFIRGFVDAYDVVVIGFHGLVDLGSEIVDGHGSSVGKGRPKGSSKSGRHLGLGDQQDSLVVLWHHRELESLNGHLQVFNEILR